MEHFHLGRGAWGQCQVGVMRAVARVSCDLGLHAWIFCERICSGMKAFHYLEPLEKSSLSGLSLACL